MKSVGLVNETEGREVSDFAFPTWRLGCHWLVLDMEEKGEKNEVLSLRGLCGVQAAVTAAS